MVLTYFGGKQSIYAIWIKTLVNNMITFNIYYKRIPPIHEIENPSIVTTYIKNIPKIEKEARKISHNSPWEGFANKVAQCK